MSSRVKVANELDQRVLAVLVVNGGQLLDDRGYCYQKMQRFMAGSYKLNNVRDGVKRLEAQNLVIRDVHAKPNAKSVPRLGGHYVGPAQGCYGLHLAVEADQLDLDQHYIEEIRKLIAERMLAKQGVKTVPRVIAHGRQPASEREREQLFQAIRDGVVTLEGLRQMFTWPDGTLTSRLSRLVRENKIERLGKGSYRAIPEPQQLPLPNIHPPLYQPLQAKSDSETVAEALLRMVVERISNPPAPPEVEVKVVGKERIAELEAKVNELRRELKLRDANMDKLIERLNKLADENEHLKKASKRTVEKAMTGGLSTQISEMLQPDERAAMERLMKPDRS